MILGELILLTMVSAGSADFDEDAFSGALLSGFDHAIKLSIRDVGKASGAARFRKDLVALSDVGQAIVEQGENVGRDLFTQSVAGAEILIDPDLHVP